MVRCCPVDLQVDENRDILYNLPSVVSIVGTSANLASPHHASYAPLHVSNLTGAVVDVRRIMS